MKSISLLAIVYLVSRTACATPPVFKYPYNWKTGSEVVHALATEPKLDRDYLERDLMHSYVNGIKDGTQGTAWCFKGAMLPHELNIEIAHAIKTRGVNALSGNAAPLVLDELRKRYPCNETKGSKR